MGAPPFSCNVRMRCSECISNQVMLTTTTVIGILTRLKEEVYLIESNSDTVVGRCGREKVCRIERYVSRRKQRGREAFN